MICERCKCERADLMHRGLCGPCEDAVVGRMFAPLTTKELQGAFLPAKFPAISEETLMQGYGVTREDVEHAEDARGPMEGTMPERLFDDGAVVEAAFDYARIRACRAKLDVTVWRDRAEGDWTYSAKTDEEGAPSVDAVPVRVYSPSGEWRAP